MKIFGMRVTWQRLIVAGVGAGVSGIAFMAAVPKILEARRMRVGYLYLFIKIDMLLSMDLFCVPDLPPPCSTLERGIGPLQEPTHLS